jgi:hypothetical protein
LKKLIKSKDKEKVNKKIKYLEIIIGVPDIAIIGIKKRFRPFWLSFNVLTFYLVPL